MAADLKRSDWRARHAIFKTIPRPDLRRFPISIRVDPKDPKKEVLEFPAREGTTQRIWLKRGSYLIPNVRVLSRPSIEVAKNPSMVPRTVCLMWPMAEKALFAAASSTFPRPVSRLDRVNLMEVRPSSAGGGFATHATCGINMGERIAVDVPLLVMPTDLPYVPDSNIMYDQGEALEQAFESLSPAEQKSFLALHPGNFPTPDFKTLLQNIVTTNQHDIGEMPGGDECVPYSCIARNLA